MYINVITFASKGANLNTCEVWKNYYPANTNPLSTKIDLKIYVDNTIILHNVITSLFNHGDFISNAPVCNIYWLINSFVWFMVFNSTFNNISTDK